jgi:pimeloyl-ACP methyl ester carboxylesterase
MTNTYVLVHGAWMGKFCWTEVVSRLETLGNTVLTLDLPAHGDDTTPAENVSLDSYRDAVLNVIGDRNNVILVGHSMAGMVISAVAEVIPAQLKSLVYLCAYLPQNGETLYQLSEEDKESLTGHYWRQENPESYSPAWIAAEGIVEVFGADCPDQYQALIVKKHRQEPLAPMVTPITLTKERYDTVPRFYIETLADRTVSHQLQTLMLSRVTVQKRFQLSSSHCPFFSVPDQLVAYITSGGSI